MKEKGDRVSKFRMYLISENKYYCGDTKDICIFKATADRSRSDNMDHYEREKKIMAEEKEWFFDKGNGWESE
jgi:hypothetical protein